MNTIFNEPPAFNEPPLSIYDDVQYLHHSDLSHSQDEPPLDVYDNDPCLLERTENDFSKSLSPNPNQSIPSVQSVQNSTSDDNEIDNDDEPDSEYLGSYNDEPPADDFKPFKGRSIEPKNGSLEPTENRSIESKPSNAYLPVILENMPAQLRPIKNWVLWRPELRENSDKMAKVPYAVNGYHAKTNNPATWSSFDSVCDVLRKNDKYSGLGFVLKTQIDGHDIVGIDVDHPFDSEIAIEFRSRFSNTYIEKSPSGKLRIFCTGVIPKSGKGVNDQQIEVYNHTSPRYLTVTGQRINQRNITLQQDALNWLFEAYFTPKHDIQQLQIKTQPNENHAVLGMGSSANSCQGQGSKYSGGGCQSTQPVQSNENNSYLDKWSDQQVIDAIKRSKMCNDFNTLFSGGSIKGNESRDDMKLAGIIAFWAGSSIGSGPEQIFRIISQSQRQNVISGKWQQRSGMDCSQKAVANAMCVYTPKPKLEPKPELKVSFNYVDDVGFKRDVKKLVTSDCNVTEVIAQLQEKHPNVEMGQIIILVERQVALLLKSRLDKANATTVTNTLDLYGMTVHESNSRYTSIPTANEGDTMIVKAAMGTGKTYYLENAIKEFKEQNLSYAYICHRISLANSASNRLNLDFYQNKIEFTQGVSIVANSIPNFSGFLGTPDVVIIDEVDQVLKHITGSACSNGSEVLKTLKEWVSKAKICIVMSADIDELTINFVKHCRPGKLNFYLNSFKPRDKQEMFVCESLSDIYCLIEDDVNTGGGCTVIATNSKEESQKVHKYLQETCKNARGFMLNSDNSENEDTLNLIKDIDNRINDLDYLIFSPSIGSGVSIETTNVSGVFGIFNSKAGGTPLDAWQQIGRVRKIDVPNYVYIDRTTNYTLPTTEDEIFDIALRKLNAVTFEIEKGNQSHWTQSGIVDSVRGYKATEFDGLCVAMYKNANILNQDFFWNFLLQGREKGIVFKEIPKEHKPDPTRKGLAKDARKTALENVKAEKEEKILNSCDLTANEVHDMVEAAKDGSKKLSQDERASLEKYSLIKDYGLNDDPNTDTQSTEECITKLKEYIKLDCNGKGRAILKRIKSTIQPITTIGDDDISALTRYIENQTLLSKSVVKRYKLIDREMIIRLFKTTGIHLTENGLEHDGDVKCYDANDADVIEFVSWCKKNGVISSKSKKSNTQIIGDLLNGLELKTVCKEYEENGKRFRKYWVKLLDKNNQPVYKFNPFLTSKIATDKNEVSTQNLPQKSTNENLPTPPPSNIYSVGGRGVGYETSMNMSVDAKILPENFEVFEGCGKHPNVILNDHDICYTKENTQKTIMVNDVCYDEKITPASTENHNKPHKVDSPKNLWRGFDSDETFWYQKTSGLSHNKRIALAHEFDVEWDRVNAENANTAVRQKMNLWLIDVTEKKAA